MVRATDIVGIIVVVGMVPASGFMAAATITAAVAVAHGVQVDGAGAVRPSVAAYGVAAAEV